MDERKILDELQQTFYSIKNDAKSAFKLCENPRRDDEDAFEKNRFNYSSNSGVVVGSYTRKTFLNILSKIQKKIVQ